MWVKLDRLVQELLRELESARHKRAMMPEESRALDIAYDIQSQCRNLSRYACEEGEGKMERAVLVTTAHRGVFFGYAKETRGPTIKLRAARNCIFWPIENKGFLGLANMGPVNGARVGPPADIELRDITCVADCTPAAIDRWESAPWE